MKIIIPITELNNISRSNPTACECIMKQAQWGAGGTLQMNETDYHECLKLKGMGDLVALVAKPIAAVIDAVVKTDLKNCGGCVQRQEWLNNKVPF